MGSTPNPPKFQAIAPQTPAEWQSFWRWLLSLWKTSMAGYNVANMPTPVATPSRTLVDSAALTALRGAPPMPGVSQPSPASIEALQRLSVPQRVQPDPAAMLAMMPQRSPGQPPQIVIQDSHANRINYPAGQYANGSMYWETDRTVMYMAFGGVWIYRWGMYSQALGYVPLDLGAADNGFLFEVTQGVGSVFYYHTFRWNGSAPFSWVPLDLGGYFEDFAIAPVLPYWVLCNGAATSYLSVSGITFTENAITLPDCTTGVYMKGGAAYTGTVNPATVPTLSGSTGAPSATVSIPSTVTAVYAAADTHTHGVGSLVASASEPKNLVGMRYFRC